MFQKAKVTKITYILISAVQAFSEDFSQHQSKCNIQVNFLIRATWDFHCIKTGNDLRIYYTGHSGPV